jgi:hypothetical protein
MSKFPSHMTKLASELGTLAFIEERYQALGIADDPAELFRQAGHLRKEIERHRYRATLAIPIGAIVGLIGFGGLVSSARPFSMDIASAVAIITLVGIAWLLLHHGFRSERQRRFGRGRKGRPRFEIESSENFSRVFEPVELGSCQLAMLSPSGTSTSFTPVSNRPVEKFIIKNSFDDAWLPADVLWTPSQISGNDRKTDAPDPDYVVISWREEPKEPRRASGHWKQYYLWHLEPAIVGVLFDRAKNIYSDKKVERLKARIAVTMVCEHFNQYREQSLTVKSQAKLAEMLSDRLKFEANQLLASGKLDPLEARKLERINLSGEVKTIDPAEPRAGMNDKPESWFYQLLSGNNDTILPYIRVEAVKDQPGLPHFLDN